MIQGIKICFVVLVWTSHVILPHSFVLNAKKIFAKTVNMVTEFSGQLETILYHHYNAIVVKIDFFIMFFIYVLVLIFGWKSCMVIKGHFGFSVFRLVVVHMTYAGTSSWINQWVNYLFLWPVSAVSPKGHLV